MSFRGSWRGFGGAAVLLASAWTAVNGAMAQAPPTRALTPAAVIDGSEEQPLRWPIAVAVGPDGEIAVADVFDPRLLLFRRTGASVGLSRSVELPAAPAAVAFDGKRYVVALRESGSLLAVEPEDGATTALALPAGVWAGRLAALPDRSLIVWDAAGRRLLHLVEGAIAAEAASAENVTAVAPARSDGFWVGVGQAGEVRRYDGAAALVAAWKVPADGMTPAWPSGIFEGGAGRLFVLDRNAGRVVVLDREGRFIGVGSGRGWDPGRLLRPIGLDRLPDGRLLVGDQGNGRVQLFRIAEGLE